MLFGMVKVKATRFYFVAAAWLYLNFFQPGVSPVEKVQRRRLRNSSGVKAASGLSTLNIGVICDAFWC
ncbi:MAG: hypothetical protein ACI94D_000226 [Neolewinella sp.]|jgi:hypothetical protein